MRDMFKALSGSARIGLIAGTVVIVLAFLISVWWAFRPNYQLLFSELRPQDAQAMTVELDRLKIPYRLGEAGSAIFVDESQVHATRLKLMGREIPLNGAVGFEIFNNTDFGMTEFSQKINYQRALQGELTRTILSLTEVRDARVHLAMPERGLFKQVTSKAKASVSVSLKQGAALMPEQVVGIQRLVAAAVPGMATQDVTVLDNHGITLSRVAGPTAGGDGGGRLDIKRETENYLSKKVGSVLEKVFGPGQALASVDVDLNMDEMKVTTEDVVPAAGSARTVSPSGVVVKERETSRDVAPLDTRSDAVGRGSTQREVDYAVGRRVEQVVAHPGSIRRLQVVAVVRSSLDAAQEDRIKRLVAAAVGALPERGDTVVVQPLESAHSQVPQPSTVPNGLTESEQAVTETDRTAPVAVGVAGVVRVLVLALLLAAVSVLVYRQIRQRGKPSTGSSLSPAQREAALQRVREWMNQDAPNASGVPGAGPGAA